MRILWLLGTALIGAAAALVMVGILWLVLLTQQIRVPGPWLAWILPTAGLVGAVVAVLSERRKLAVYQDRFTANQEFAAKLCLTFSEKCANLDWPTPLADSVHDGQNEVWLHRWQGEHGGLPVDVADVRYVLRDSSSEGGGSSTTHEHTVYTWKLQQQSLPAFSIVEKHSRIMAALMLLGGEKILGFEAEKVAGADAEVVRNFNQRFLVFARPHADGSEPARRICVPRVMRALLEAGHVRVVSHQEWIACWWPGMLSWGQLRCEQMQRSHRLISTILAASADQAPTVVPADPHVSSNAALALLPPVCAVAMAGPGFVLGGILVAFLTFQFKPQFESGKVLFPVIVFGTMFFFAGSGWFVGKLIERRSTRHR